MGLMTALEISASGLAAQRKRLEVAVSNLVNAETTRPAGTEPFRRKDVVFAATSPQTTFGGELTDAMEGVSGVEVVQVVADQRPPLRRYEPGHPYADKDGYVTYPDIDPMKEMLNMLSATRSYEANIQAVNTTKDMALKTLEIIR